MTKICYGYGFAALGNKVRRLMSFAIDVQPVTNSYVNRSDGKANPKSANVAPSSNTLGRNSNFSPSFSRPSRKPGEFASLNGNLKPRQIQQRIVSGIDITAFLYRGSYRRGGMNSKVVCNVRANWNHSRFAIAKVNLRKNVLSAHS